MTSLPPPVQSVLELFQGPLASVRFADIDAAGLVQLAAEVEAASNQVREQEEKLTELRQALAQRQEALLVLAQQALAYARVYAENDEGLLDAVNRISLTRAAKPRKALPGKGAAARGEAVGDNGDTGAPTALASDADADAVSVTGSDASANTPDAEAESAPVAVAVRGTRKGRAAAQRTTN